MTNSKNTLDSFLKSNPSGTERKYTVTRIPDKDLKIYGGSYSISDDKYDEFLKLYYKKVFIDGEMEYLAEKQLIENGPILIDIDFRYNSDITSKQHTDDHVFDFVSLYMEKLLKYVSIESGTKINVYVLEKKHTCQDKDITKDGIHIVISLQTHKAIQCLVRNDMLGELPEIWDDLPITNTWDQVYDDGVAKGTVGWQVYGSRKPGKEAYLIKKFYTIDIQDFNYMEIKDNGDISKFNTKKHFKYMCARYTNLPNTTILENKQSEFNKMLESLSSTRPKKNIKIKKTLGIVRYDLIRSEDELDDLLEDMFDSCLPTEYKYRETHNYVMALPNSYYGPGSYVNWMKVGWALANTGRKMFLSWLKFSCQDNCRMSLRGVNGKFNWDMVPELFDTWCSFDFDNKDGLSNRSIMYWAKTDAPEKFEEIKKETVDYFIDQTIVDVTEFDLATVLYNIFKDKYVCVSIKQNIWYYYKNNRWYENDSGTNLRKSISVELYLEYIDRIRKYTNTMQAMDQSDSAYEPLRKKTSKLTDIATLLRKSQWKSNIMKEAKELFYDSSFMSKLDQNPYLLCFNNMVVDFKNNVVRKGNPEDYLSKCTNIDYVKLDHSKHGETIAKINTFLDQLFPIPELRKYMFEHLASVLIGTTHNQTFNIYTGTGRNGKSRLVDLMIAGLGDYKGTVPTTLITQKRTGIGSTSSEVAQLIGVRYAVMSELSKGEKINEGIMKEITGGDAIQARALFKDSITFNPQFKLVLCTNSLLDVTSNDDGTWRRIRVCDFKSKFVKNPYNCEDEFPKEDFPYQYKVNPKIIEEFKDWAPIFMSMLVEKAFETKGLVEDCPTVMASSNEYREGQDYLAEFLKEKTIKRAGEKVKKTELYESFKEWYTINHGRRVPKAKEIYEVMDKKYGRYKAGWHNVSIVYDEDEEFDEF